MSVALLVVYVSETNPPVFVLALSIALLVQGSNTLAAVFGAFRLHGEAARQLQVAGSILALVTGTVLFASGFVINIDPSNTDPEYGPMTIALLISGHAIASLLAFVPPRPATTSTP